MPLPRMSMPRDLLHFTHGGSGVALNTKRYPEFLHVRGVPEFAAIKGDQEAALREAFATLLIARRFAAYGDQQAIYLGEESVRFLYGGSKKSGDQDCDVVGKVLAGGYGLVLGEGKGADLAKAWSQFCSAAERLKGRGVLSGGVIVTNSLRWMEWSTARNQWVGMMNNVPDEKITQNVAHAVSEAKPPLMKDKVYLLDSPWEDGHQLPSWCINPQSGPVEIYFHSRTSPGERNARKLMLGAGAVRLAYVV
ncbi:MAG: hypothetical protein MUF01_05240 [Bryobacterales bacterium]|nr:hypothetical protein [Bryobacterales bacterium]